MTKAPKAGLDLLREPFPAHQISKLPKPTKAQTDAVKSDFKSGMRCKLCGAWHHKDVVHLDYVGHAALTDRLLDADPAWFWEPAALQDGLPAFDQSGGLWIKLTVCGVTRLGYGHAAAKPSQDPGAREKEVIGDALRNAAMPFGAALDLWHKGDLHGDDEAAPVTDDAAAPVADDAPPPAPARDPVAIATGIISAFGKLETYGALIGGVAEGSKVASAWDWLELEHKAEAARVRAAFDARKAELTQKEQAQ